MQIKYFSKYNYNKKYNQPSKSMFTHNFTH